MGPTSLPAPLLPSSLPYAQGQQLCLVEHRDRLQHQQHHQKSVPASSTLTCNSFTAGGVVRFELVALYAQALVAPQSVDALLAAGVGGGALVDVNARLPIILQPKPGPASALQEATRRC